MAIASDGTLMARKLAEHEHAGYWLRVQAVMEAVADEFDQCDSKQAIRILAALGVRQPQEPSASPATGDGRRNHRDPFF